MNRWEAEESAYRINFMNIAIHNICYAQETLLCGHLFHTISMCSYHSRTFRFNMYLRSVDNNIRIRSNESERWQLPGKVIKIQFHVAWKLRIRICHINRMHKNNFSFSIVFCCLFCFCPYVRHSHIHFYKKPEKQKQKKLFRHRFSFWKTQIECTRKVASSFNRIEANLLRSHDVGHESSVAIDSRINWIYLLLLFGKFVQQSKSICLRFIHLYRLLRHWGKALDLITASIYTYLIRYT